MIFMICLFINHSIYINIMAVNLHQPSVYALFEAMPIPLLTLGVSGLVTYANSAAKQHPGRPVESMSGKPVIK